MASHRAATGRVALHAGRLRRRSEFRDTLEEGARWPGRRVVVYVRPAGPGTRAGFVCARQVGGAVTRNRARRILKEAWRAVAAQVRDGFDVVFVARPAIAGAGMNELVGEMEDALEKAGVMSR